MSIPTTAPFTEETVVSTIDTNEAWFLDPSPERFHAPGKRIAPDNPGKQPNQITRSQLGVVIRGLQSSNVTNAMKLVEAFDVGRGRQFANLRGNQYDINMVDYFSVLANQANADLPLTPAQSRMVDVTVKALLGTAAHFNNEVQGYINQLSDSDRERFIRLFEEADTQGQLNKVITMYERRVPSPRDLQRQAQTTAQSSVAELDIEDDAEESF